MAEPIYPLFKYIVAKYFFEKYAPSVKMVKHKLRGIDGNGNAIDFTEADKKAIEKGLSKFTKDIVKLTPK